MHVGGAACAFPRWLHATRPGSTQVVLEPDAELTAAVLDRLPLPDGVEVRAVDGRTGLRALPDASADVVVVDAWADRRVPPELTTAELVADCRRVLGPDGLLLLNVADGPGSTYLGRLLVTFRPPGGEVVAVGPSPVLLGEDFGNVVVAAGPLDAAALWAAAEGVDQAVLHGAALDRRAAGAAPLTDADPVPTPAPAQLADRSS